MEIKFKFQKVIGMSVLLIIGHLAFGIFTALAVEGILPPPIITLYNKDASNNEIFYIGGTTVVPEGDIIIYMQRSDGAALSYSVKADNKGAWFYSSQEFLSPGEYIVWTQAKSGEILSPPSPQINVKVLPVAFQLAGLRVTYEFFYILSILLFLILFVPTLLFGIYHWRSHKVKTLRLYKELADVERSVRHGFSVLKKDIEEELHKLKGGGSKEKEKKMLHDLHVVKKYIDKEVLDIAKLENLA